MYILFVLTTLLDKLTDPLISVSVHRKQCTLDTVHCAQCTQEKIYTEHFSLHTMYIWNNVHWTLYTAHNVHCKQCLLKTIKTEDNIHNVKSTVHIIIYNLYKKTAVNSLMYDINGKRHAVNYLGKGKNLH